MTSPIAHDSAPEQLEITAEIQRLAKLLSLNPEELAYLRGVEVAELRALRGQVTSTLFDGQAALVRIAATTRVIPASLAATMAEKVFGPMLAARIAGLVDPDRAVEIASRLPTPFLADVAVELDPRRVAAILAKIPSATVAEVTRLLAEREEWVAMGMFLAYLPHESIRTAMAQIDARASLHVALLLDDKSRLSEVWELGDDATLLAIPAIAEAEGLSAQLQALGVYLTPRQLSRLGG